MTGKREKRSAGRAVRRVQNVSQNCLVCGRENALGLHGRFYELEGQELLGVFATSEEHQSYPGRLHGGIASAILDETIGRAILLLHPDAWGVTAEITLRFRQPVPLGGEIRCLARITRDTSRLFEGTGEILLEDGAVAVEARGKYVKMGIGTIAEGFDGSEWFPDERDRPEQVEL